MKISLTILSLLFSFNMLFSQGLNQRIESEYKLSVPNGQEKELWSFLKESFSTAALAKINSDLSSNTSTEYFIDQYFDNEEQTLLKNKAGARYRERYLQDSLLKALVQLKLSGVDSSGVARMEVKFNHYEKIKKKDRQAMHPFWKHIKPKDRADVDLALAIYKVTGSDLLPALKLRQDRKRVYIFEKEAPLMTITLDRVQSFYFPYPEFTEMELELNEIRYTKGSSEERKWMEDFNKKVKKQILEQFPDLQQDQTPKYNKMSALVSKNKLASVLDNFSYFILAGIVGFAIFLFWRREIN